MPMITFHSKGFASEANARKKLDRDVDLRLSTNARMIVAVQDGRFFPVVVLQSEDLRYARNLADKGIYVVG